MAATITYRCRVGWHDVGLTNTTLFNARTTTAYDDISGDVMHYSWHRGRNTPDDVINAGTLMITLTDLTGKYEQYNAASILYAYQPWPMKTVYVQASTDGGTTWKDRYFGFIRAINWDPDPTVLQSEMECIDAFVYLQSVIPTIASMGTTTVGAAITAILSASFNTSITTSIAASDAIPDFSATGTITSLTAINNLMVTALGLFFVAGNGTLTYLWRYDFNRPPRNVAQSTLVNECRGIQIGVTLDSVQNGAHVLRTGGVQQDFSNATSQNSYGRIDIPLITSSYLNTDNQALGLAQYLVALHRNAIGQLKGITINAATSTNARDTILSREVGDHINIQSTTMGSPPVTFNQDFDIVGITENVTPGGASDAGHTATFILYSRNIYGLPIIFDQSKFDGTDVMVY